MGKTLHKKEQLLSKLFFNILKKYQKNRLLFCAPMDHLLLKYFFQKDKAEIIRISKIVNCRLHLSPSICHAYVIAHTSFILAGMYVFSSERLTNMSVP